MSASAPGACATLSIFGQVLGARARARARREPEPTSIASLTVLNAGAEVTVSSGGAIYASVQNVLDRRYVVARRPAGARPGLPRTLMVGYRMGT